MKTQLLLKCKERRCSTSESSNRKKNPKEGSPGNTKQEHRPQNRKEDARRNWARTVGGGNVRIASGSNRRGRHVIAGKKEPPKKKKFGGRAIHAVWERNWPSHLPPAVKKKKVDEQKR